MTQLLPEALLFLTLLCLVFAEIGYFGERVRTVTWIAVFGVAAAMVQILVVSSGPSVRFFGDQLTFDGVSFFSRLVALGMTLLGIILGSFSHEIEKSRRAEFFALSLAMGLGLCLVSIASHLVFLFMALQLVGVAGVFLVGYNRTKSHSVEGASKFLIFHFLSSIFFLVAAGLLYTQTHSFQLIEIQQSLIQSPLSQGVLLTLLTLLFFSAAFFMGLFPMNLWVPDVLEGAPWPAKIVFGGGFPLVGFALVFRFIPLFSGNDGFPGAWELLVVLTASVTMIWAAVLSMAQKSAKRMISYMVLFHFGLTSVGFLLLSREGISAVYYHLLSSSISLAGTVGCLVFFQNRTGLESIEGWAGLLRRHVPETVAFFLFLGSFLGMPPLSGFVGRFFLLSAMTGDGRYFLGTVAMLSSVLILYSFSRICSTVGGSLENSYAEPSGIASSDGPLRFYLLFLLLPLAFLTVFSSAVLHWTLKASRLILW